ncbi:transcriptional regulator [Amycolatopsis sp. GM8]|uniref:transcriptional regulator n=1 Tax=Amycolatopsis sp. GM8 TaxID=2896530 RepID=UPI001F465A24|nr:transcriptional regulator [Amycolatopsis sp. GM8]
MTEDWAAVASAINRRMVELGLSQRDLVARSHVSKSVVREIQHNLMQRRRSDRTLEALSLALEWHPAHLAAALAGRRPPEVGEPFYRSEDDISGRLAVIEHQLREITDRLREFDALDKKIDDINTGVASVVEHIAAERERRRR